MAIFIAVIDAGGFSPAARRLKMSHSAIREFNSLRRDLVPSFSLARHVA
ncbi:hypothetical protein [Phyllobacterium phragmitis]